MTIAEKYYLSESDSIVTVWDLYRSYLREKEHGNSLSESFGQFLKWTDGLFPIE